MGLGAGGLTVSLGPSPPHDLERNHDYKQLPALVHGAGDHWMVGVLHGRCAWVVLEEREGKAASSSHQQPPAASEVALREGLKWPTDAQT